MASGEEPRVFRSDFLVIGTGIAGLQFALKAAAHGTVNVLSKKEPEETNTFYAQGGIAAAISSGDSVEDHERDTLAAGNGLCHEDAVRIMVEGGPAAIQELVDLGRGQFNLAAVVSEEVPASDLEGALNHWRGQGRQVIRVASEFPGIADAYARGRHLGRYQVIPIAGASEGFVPEDAELLIEGTETGRTLAENRLKLIEFLFRSTACLIAARGRKPSGRRRSVFDQVVAALQSAAEAARSL